MMDTAGEENAKGWGRKGVLSYMASWISFLDGPREVYLLFLSFRCLEG